MLSVLERGAESVEHLLAAVPKMMTLLADAETMLGRANALVDGIDQTRAGADAVVERTNGVVDKADALIDRLTPVNDRLVTLLDGLEPSLTKLQPTLERLAETTDPHEVDAMVQLIDTLPRLADKLETDIMPILDTLNTVAPDLHDLLEVSRELNEMLEQVPGISRIKRRIDRQQAEDAEEAERGRPGLVAGRPLRAQDREVVLVGPLPLEQLVLDEVRLVPHADLGEHPRRCPVAGVDAGDHPTQAEPAERDVEHVTRTLGGQAASLRSPGAARSRPHPAVRTLRRISTNVTDEAAGRRVDPAEGEPLVVDLDLELQVAVDRRRAGLLVARGPRQVARDVLAPVQVEEGREVRER